MTSRQAVKVAIAPAVLDSNPFAQRFSSSIATAEVSVEEFVWGVGSLSAADVIIFHWPDKLLFGGTPMEIAKALAKLGLLRLFKLLKRQKLIWVAHNVRPHDSQEQSAFLNRLFLNSLDGVVYLSEVSRKVVHAEYQLPPGISELVIVHGHYRGTMQTPVTPPPALGDAVRLAYFGQVRPYKGVEDLVSCAREMNGKGLSLTVLGQRRDEALARSIEAIAADAPNIHCDVREGLVPDTDLEAAIDAAHAVALPYRNILNSGSALLALSRNRPILAPRTGSLIELQEALGDDWVHLYEGDLSVAVLEDFTHWIRQRQAAETCDLSAFDWPPIGAKLREFIRSLKSA